MKTENDIWSGQAMYDGITGFIADFECELSVMHQRLDFLARQVKPLALKEARAELKDPLFNAGLSGGIFVPSVNQTETAKILPEIDVIIGAASNNQNLATVPLNVARWSMLTFRAELIKARLEKVERISYFTEGLTSAYDLSKQTDLDEFCSYFAAMLNSWKCHQRKHYPLLLARLLYWFRLDVPDSIKEMIVFNGDSLAEIETDTAPASAATDSIEVTA